MQLLKRVRFAIASVCVAGLLGCGGAEVVAPKADNPNSELQPAGRNTDGGSPATAESSSLP